MSDRLFEKLESSLREDRISLAIVLRRLVEKHVTTESITGSQVRAILQEYDEVRKERYGSRKGSTQSPMHELVADVAREGWLEAVDDQARQAKELIREAG